jgi:hypothetical protein
MTGKSIPRGSQSWKVLWCGLAVLGGALIAAPAGAAKATAAPPGAPTITSVTAATRSVIIVFTAPTSNGGAPITHYRAKCVSSNGGKTGTGASHKLHVRARGLTGGKTYTCTVVARNRAGVGPASAPSSSVVTLGH